MRDSSDVILPISNQQKQAHWTNNLSSTAANIRPSAPSKSTARLDGMIYRSDIMRSLEEMVKRIAPTQATVLIQGESGTGKELIAKALHQHSGREHKPFVAINCSTLKDSLLESELFGHEKGAFTGAFQSKPGMAEVANGGTLFLDEIGDMSLTVQTKLLRFLQEGEFYRVGGKEKVKVDVRIVCATNKDLETLVTQRQFREDLYYRINTIILETAPLRRRKQDIPVLIEHFMKNGKINYGRKEIKLSEQAMSLLVKYEWPGNIRELENLCERLQVLTDKDVIDVGHLPDFFSAQKKFDITRDYDASVSLSEIEKNWIIKAMDHFKGNKTQTANSLGITIKTLYNKLHEYGVFEKYAQQKQVENG